MGKIMSLVKIVIGAVVGGIVKAFVAEKLDSEGEI
jgi:hypothetical protein